MGRRASNARDVWGRRCVGRKVSIPLSRTGQKPVPTRHTRWGCTLRDPYTYMLIQQDKIYYFYFFIVYCSFPFYFLMLLFSNVHYANNTGLIRSRSDFCFLGDFWVGSAVNETGILLYWIEVGYANKIASWRNTSKILKLISCWAST